MSKKDEAIKIMPSLLSMIDGDVQKSIFYLPKAATLALIMEDDLLAHRIMRYQHELEELSQDIKNDITNLLTQQ